MAEGSAQHAGVAAVVEMICKAVFARGRERRVAGSASRRSSPASRAATSARLRAAGAIVLAPRPRLASADELDLPGKRAVGVVPDPVSRACDELVRRAHAAVVAPPGRSAVDEPIDVGRLHGDRAVGVKARHQSGELVVRVRLVEDRLSVRQEQQA